MRSLRRQRPAGTPTARIPAAVLDLLPDGVLVVDTNGDAILINAAARAMRLTRGDRLAVSELRGLARAVRRDARKRTAELDLPKRTRDQGPLAVRVRAVSIGGGDVALLVEDLSELRRTEQLRREFTVNASHELQTPIGALQVLAEAVAEANGDPNVTKRFAGQIANEARRLGTVVREIVALARTEDDPAATRHDLVAVDDVLDSALAQVQHALQAKPVTLLREGSRGLTVDGDSSSLTTMTVNLLDNAIFYSPAASTVRVCVEREDDSLQLSVTDQGIGIAGRDLERIFERFYRVDPARSRETGGTGLGLAIVKQIVSAHGGSVMVDSTPGSGSTFTVSLPLAGYQAGGHD